MYIGVSGGLDQAQRVVLERQMKQQTARQFELANAPGLLSALLKFVDNDAAYVGKGQGAAVQQNRREEHRILWPNVHSAVLMILHNLSHVAANELEIARHDELIDAMIDCLSIDESSQSLALGVLSNVASSLDLAKHPRGEALVLHLQTCICRVEDVFRMATSLEAHPMMRALRTIPRLAAVSESNCDLVAKRLDKYTYALLLSFCRLDSIEDKTRTLNLITVGSLNALLYLARGSAHARVMLASQTPMLRKLLAFVLTDMKQTREYWHVHDVAVALVAATFDPVHTLEAFRAAESQLWVAATQNRECAMFFSPILGVLARMYQAENQKEATAVSDDAAVGAKQEAKQEVVMDDDGGGVAPMDSSSS
eukprot:TRINITY_DN66406_c9_g2_i3.p1 TRINITY_DN66406_c9_g2~~TRINITY_DN66406_c9_g2_i3.p1  ORF type:complete len:429 (+),score=231.62 TRINITY_DN66406_c9_g2_i3:188-1288(+)